MNKALYRVYRPQTFDEVRDQKSITNLLKNQVHTGNIGHAYLFSGSRGTGKTSCAKIFSRAVNCLNPVGGNPCNECENCRAILDETTMDVVEMDAASNRGIDDVRDLRDKVIYPPTQLKYKVYIIDEAHMITNDAFNALLKIMEEPPEHLIFILATTELEKIPITILSRTQRYEFKRIDLQAIEDNVRDITAQMGRKIDDEAIRSIAIAADGAMRDALSLLDQVMTNEVDVITQETVDSVLGTVGFSAIYQLTDMIFKNQRKQALQRMEEILQSGKDAENFLKEMIAYFRLLLLYKATEDISILQTDLDQANQIQELCKQVEVQRILDSIEILLETEQWMRRSDYGQILMETTVIKLINHKSMKDLNSRIESLEAKLATIERWQIPEVVVQNEVADILGEWKREGTLVVAPASSFQTQSSTQHDAIAAIEAVSQREEGEHAPDQVAAPEPEEEIQEESFVEEVDVQKEEPKAVEPEPVEQPEAKVEAKAEASKTKIYKRKNPFEQDPIRWIDERSADFYGKLNDKAALRQELVGRFEEVLTYKDQVWFIYPDKEVFLIQVIGVKAPEIEDTLEEMVGVKYQVHVATRSDVPTHVLEGDDDEAYVEEPVLDGDDSGEVGGMAQEMDAQPVVEEPEPVEPEPQPEEKQGEEKQTEEKQAEEKQTEAKDPIQEKLEQLIPADLLEIQEGDSN